jgi:hypothetical protein
METAEKNRSELARVTHRRKKRKQKGVKAKAIIVDLDNTLSNCNHRIHHMKGKKKNYFAFMAGIGDDKLNEWCAVLVKAMYEMGYDIIYLTGRDEPYRQASELWLLFNSPVQDYLLLMRKAKDHRKDFVVKKEIYEQEVAPFYDVLFALDDRAHIAKMWRSIGLPCLHCDEDDIGETVDQKEELKPGEPKYSVDGKISPHQTNSTGVR